MKTDPRVRYTQNIIEDVFLKLLKDKPLSKITVKEICEGAQINRGTFYKHYQDCYDLMDKIEQKAMDDFDAMLAEIETDGVQQGILTVLNALKSHNGLFNTIAMHSPDHGFTAKMAGRCFQYMMPRVKISEELGFNDAQKGASYAYLVGGSGAVIEYWLRSGMKEPPEVMAKTMFDLNALLADGLTNDKGDKGAKGQLKK